ncbi:MAG: hypothetical protein JW924_03105 [Fusobacteriaceae bacterium]|nr:hypothetical protein [Fusobacteriaceae bacterium]
MEIISFDKITKKYFIIKDENTEFLLPGVKIKYKINEEYKNGIIEYSNVVGYYVSGSKNDFTALSFIYKQKIPIEAI